MKVERRNSVTAKVKKIMKNPATTVAIVNYQLPRPGRLALVKGEGDGEG